MKKGCRLLSFLIIWMMITAPFTGFVTEAASFDASGRDGRAPEESFPEESTEVTVVNSVEELSEESDAAYDNDAYFTIDTAKDDSADLATDELSEEVTDILSGGESAPEKQKGVTDTLESSGLYRAEEDGASKVDVTSKFAYQRLRLVAPQKEELNAYGATKAVYFEDSYLLSYDSMEATMQAYEALVSEYGADAVFIDTPMKICDGEKGWGTAFMRMDRQKNLADSSGQVIVAVIDSGIKRSHPVFSGRTILDGHDFVNNDNDPADDDGHGTAVSGIIAESTPPNVKILPLKAMDAKGEGSEFDVMNAIKYAEEHGADIINLSIGGYLNHSEMEKYEKAFRNYGALIVCAAGNENKNMDAPDVDEFPGEISSTVCVGAITPTMTRLSFSNYGKAIDFAAPGGSLMLAQPGGSYGSGSGTSFSSPYIAAAAALVKADHEDYSNEQIISCLEGISEDLGDPGRDVYYGRGCPRFPEDTTFREASCPKKITPVVRMSKTVYTWNGKERKPSVTVYDGKTKLPSSQYKLSYSGGRKNVGTYSVKVTLQGGYSGTKTVTYKICPKGTGITGLTGAKKALTVTWKKQSAKMSSGVISGYKIQTATDAEFTKNRKTVTVSGYKSTSRKVRGLKTGKKYYVRVRTYKTIKNKKTEKKKTYYSGWSEVKAVRIR